MREDWGTARPTARLRDAALLELPPKKRGGRVEEGERSPNP